MPVTSRVLVVRRRQSRAPLLSDSDVVELERPEATWAGSSGAGERPPTR